MPVIEVDMLISFVNELDKYHEIAVKLFKSIASGKVRNVKVASSAYLEYDLILRSKGYSDREIGEDLAMFSSISNLGEAPLTAKVLIKASEIRGKHGLTFFDSLHGATALLTDGTMISVDEAYKKVEGLRVISPKTIK